MRDVAQVLRSLRQAKGMSYDDIGYKAGVSGTAISNIENGHTKFPKVNILEKICKALEVSPLVFFDNDFIDKLDQVQVIELNHIPEEIKQELINPEFLPWLITATKGYKNKIDADLIYDYVEYLIKYKHNFEKIVKKNYKL